jgi:hypothetical protein
MNLKPTPLYLLSFFSLVFLLHEIHDWIRILVSGSFCHCWGIRFFDGWTPCASCGPGGQPQVLGLVAAALIIYIAIWTSWMLMYPGNSLQRKSFGFSLLFASLPFMRILHACLRDGDETTALRTFFQHPRGIAHTLIPIGGLLIVLALTLPALARAFMLLPGWKLKFLAFPLFLVLPGVVDRLIVHYKMNELLDGGFMQRIIIRGVPLLVMAWLFFLLVIYLFTQRSLATLLDYQEEFDL